MNKLLPIQLIVYWLLVYCSPLIAQSSLPEPFFDTQIKLEKTDKVLSVRPLCLAQQNPSQSKLLAVISRRGNYPDYQIVISLFRLNDDINWQPQRSQIRKLTKAHSPNWTQQSTFIVPSKNSDYQTAIGYTIIDECSENQALVLFYKNSLVVFALDPNNQLTQLSTTPIDSIFLQAEQGDLPYLNLINDYDGDGSFDLLTPVQLKADQPFANLQLTTGIFSKQPKVRALDYKLKHFVSSFQRNQPLSFRYQTRQSSWIPEIANLDFNGDGLKDIILLWQDEFEVFSQDPKRLKHFTKNYSKRFGILTEEDRSSSSTFASSIAAHVNDDGFADILVNKFSGSLATLNTQSQLFTRTADQELLRPIPRPKDKASGAILLDINNDKRLDLVTATAESGIFAAAKALLTGSVSVDFYFYLANEQGWFNDEPDFKRELDFKFDTRTFNPKGFLPTLEGDFDGDGMPDAMYGKDQNELHIILQRPGYFFPRTITYKGSIDVSENYYLDDLTGNQRTDVIFWYANWNKRNIVRIILNRGLLN